jgi:hypothetical protein
LIVPRRQIKDYQLVLIISKLTFGILIRTKILEFNKSTVHRRFEVQPPFFLMGGWVFEPPVHFFNRRFFFHPPVHSTVFDGSPTVTMVHRRFDGSTVRLSMSYIVLGVYCFTDVMRGVSVKAWLSGFGLNVKVEVSRQSIDEKRVWLLVLPKVFQAFWKAVRGDKADWPVHILEIAKADIPWLQAKGPAAVAALVKDARKQGLHDGARAMVDKIVSIRDENVLVLNAASASQHARAVVNKVFMREKADGSRTGVQVHGVRLPKVFSPKSVADAATDELILSELSMYTVDLERKIQFASIESVLDKAVVDGDGNFAADSIVSVVVIDFLDATSVTKGSKRTPCRIRLFSRDLFAGSGCSPSVVWFDYEGPVHKIVDFAGWRTAEYNRVVDRVVDLRCGVRIKVVWVWLIGDNERLQIEQGGCTGNSICRCAHCFAPAMLFGLLPRAGDERTVKSGLEAFRDAETAEARLQFLENVAPQRSAVKIALVAHIKAMHGSISRPPLISEGATFDLRLVSMSPAILHDVAQLLTHVKVFINLNLPADARVDAAQFLPCSQRRIEMSKWRKVFGALPVKWQFVPDLASQLTFMLWRKEQMSFEYAVRAQACALSFSSFCRPRQTLLKTITCKHSLLICSRSCLPWH